MDPPTDEKSVHRALCTPSVGPPSGRAFILLFCGVGQPSAHTRTGCVHKAVDSPTDEKSVRRALLPLGGGVLRIAFLTCFSVIWDSLLPTPVPGAFIRLWILPRTKKVSTGHFFALPPVGPSFRIPAAHLKKRGTPMGCPAFWRSSRDSNPGDTFMPYEISSHASSTSLSTAPYNLLIIPIPRGKIKHKKHPPLA